MVDFWVYDVAFLILFSIFVIWFLKSRTHNLSREGIIFMYRTQLGVKAIRWTGDTFKRLLHSIKYLVVGVGFLLMGVMVWMLWRTLAIYINNPEITQIIKAPPIAPLIPYFPKLFGMSSLFPPFYFTYFIVAIAIVAVVHEFSHGIFMRVFKIKIKSTGLVFLGPILGAFVEEERSGFEKKKNLEQMTVLAAGVFANLVFALIFYGLYVWFFLASFTPSGYIFTSYGLDTVPVAGLNVISPSIIDSGVNLTAITFEGKTYYLDARLATQLEMEGIEYIVAYHDAPAVKAQMRGAIIRANDVVIKHHEDLRAFMQSKEPGDEVVFMTETPDGVTEHFVILTEHPEDSSRAYLGVGHSSPRTDGVVQKFIGMFMSFKDSSTYYKATWDGNFVEFVSHFLWWIMIINFLVALFNMLPLGILDGGRFFYLTVLSITKSEKAAAIAYKWVGKLIILVFVLLMVFWFIRIV